MFYVIYNPESFEEACSLRFLYPRVVQCLNLYTSYYNESSACTVAEVMSPLAQCLHMKESYEILNQLQSKTNIFIFNIWRLYKFNICFFSIIINTAYFVKTYSQPSGFSPMIFNNYEFRNMWLTGIYSFTIEYFPWYECHSRFLQLNTKQNIIKIL